MEPRFWEKRLWGISSSWELSRVQWSNDEDKTRGKSCGRSGTVSQGLAIREHMLRFHTLLACYCDCSELASYIMPLSLEQATAHRSPSRFLRSLNMTSKCDSDSKYIERRCGPNVRSHANPGSRPTCSSCCSWSCCSLVS